MVIFVKRGNPCQVIQIKKAIFIERIDSKIAYPEGGQVLEEMRPLAWIDAIMRQP